MLKIILFLLAVLYLSLLDAKATKEEIHNAHKLLKQLIDSQNYCTASSDCVILPTGTRPCGGPSDYIVYSKSNEYADDIKKLAALTSKLEEDFHKDNTVGPFCPTIVEPTGMCSNNACQQDKRSTILYAIVYPIGRS